MARVAAADREAHFEARREQILEAAVRLIARGGFAATPVEAIAREAGVSKGTVYLYYENKDALLDAMIERYSLLPDIRALSQQLGALPLPDLVRAAVPLLWGRLKERRAVLGVLLREGPARPDNARLFLERVVLPTNRVAAELVARGIGPERAAEIDPFVAARALVGMLLVFFVSQELLGGAGVHPIPDAAITDTISEVFLHGVMGRGGER